jgi:hypothetical protein
VIAQLERRSHKDLKAQLIARAWHDPDFKRQLLANPKAAIEQEFGIELPAELEVTAVEDTPAHLHLVVPVNHTALSEERLITEEGPVAYCWCHSWIGCYSCWAAPAPTD